MTLQQIKYFHAVADALSFRVAAEKSYTTQSAISKQIALLEEELGIPLLARTNKYVRLTPAGAVFLEKSRAALDTLCDAVEAAAQISQGVEGTLRIGLLESMNRQFFLTDHVHNFQEKYPKVQLSFECDRFQALKDLLSKGKLDAIYTMAFDLKPGENFVLQRLRQGNLVVVMNRSHPLNALEHIPLSALKAETFLNIDTHNDPHMKGGLNRFVDYFKPYEIKRVSVKNFDTLFLYVELGMGIAILDDHLHLMRSPLLAYRQIQPPWQLENLYSVIAWRKDNLNPSLPLYINEIL